MTRDEVQRLLADVAFPGYTFSAGGTDRLHLRASFVAPRADDGNHELQWTRRWYVSQLASRSEIVQTAWKCVLTAVEHEAREAFKYRGYAIFGPHLDVDGLQHMCESYENVRRRAEEVRS